MRHAHFRHVPWIVGACVFSTMAAAQTSNLPGVTVTAPYTRHWGGYTISGNFKVDPRFPYMVFPAKPLKQHDILVVQPVNLNDDEYLVLQECAVAGCVKAKVVRVWNTNGSTMAARHGGGKIWIRHENKYFLWLKRLPEVGSTAGCYDCGSHFMHFKPFSPPMTLVPEGSLAAYHQAAIEKAEKQDPIPVKKSVHEGSTFVVTYASGSVVRIKRERADRYRKHQHPGETN